MYETESVESSLRFAIKNLGSKLKTAESRKIEDRVFYKNLGYWIDQQCTEHAVKTVADWARIKPLDSAAGALGRELEALRLIVAGKSDDVPVLLVNGRKAFEHRDPRWIVECFGKFLQQPLGLTVAAIVHQEKPDIGIMLNDAHQAVAGFNGSVPNGNHYIDIE